MFLYRIHGPISYPINRQLINSSFLQHLPTKLTFFLFLHIQIPVSSLAKLCQSSRWLVHRGTEDICVWYMGNLHVCWWSGWYNASGKEMSRIFEEITIQIITTCIYYNYSSVTWLRSIYLPGQELNSISCASLPIWNMRSWSCYVFCRMIIGSVLMWAANP